MADASAAQAPRGDLKVKIKIKAKGPSAARLIKRVAAPRRDSRGGGR